MRTSIRFLIAGAAAVGLLATGTSPALAGEESSDDDPSTVTAAAEGGDAGYAGDGGLGVTVCPSIAVLAPAEANCDAGNGGNANGGDAEATAEDDSKDKEYSKEN